MGADLTLIEQLGRAIFFDKTLSLNEDQSCASCHDPAAGWTGPTSKINAGGAVYEGSVPEAFGDRKPPSAAYATQSPILSVDQNGRFTGGNFWDGRATGETLGNPAAEQAQGPFLNPKEHALPDSACVVYRVCSASYPVALDELYPGACAIIWPSDTDAACHAEGEQVGLSDSDRDKANAAYDKIALAIAAFEASPEVNAFTSKFDNMEPGKPMAGKVQLSQEERHGFALFQGKGKCAQCHTANGQRPLFTDYSFANLGLPKNPENPVYLADPDYVDPGLGGFLATRPDYAGYAAESWGKHKVPTLRNLALGPMGLDKAYGHNGYFKSLEAIVHFYNTRDVKPTCPGDFTEAEALAANCWPAPEVVENVNTAEMGNLGLTLREEDAIVAFLKTLSDIPAIFPFNDVSPTDWAYSYIIAIYEAGITTGCGNENFCPLDLVTRAQMAVFLVRALEGDPAADYCGGVDPFSDVSASAWSCGHIKRLVELGITQGCDDDRFCPNANVTREQMAVFIVRAVEGEPAADYCGGSAPFNDVSASAWSCGYIKRLVELGITSGCGGGNYCPDASVTREQMAAFLARAFLEME
jgi:cytochrome c peroxidase